jgi:hypothetical protein
MKLLPGTKVQFFTTGTAQYRTYHVVFLQHVNFSVNNRLRRDRKALVYGTASDLRIIKKTFL